MNGLCKLSSATGSGVVRRSLGTTCLMSVENTNNVMMNYNNSNNNNLQQCRLKHSNRQLKRLFKHHPGRLRNSRKSPPSPPPEPKFEPVMTDVKMLPNGWIPPPPAEFAEDIEKLREVLPFSISRTRNKPNNAIGFLPVYSDIRNGGTKNTTIIKKVTGDRKAFVQELIAVLQLQDKLHKTVNDMIRFRASGTVIEVDGNHTNQVKKWLASLGF